MKSLLPLMCALVGCGSAAPAAVDGPAATLCPAGEGPVVLASVGRPTYGNVLAVDATFVYWTDWNGHGDGFIERVPKAGGSVEQFPVGVGVVNWIATDDQNVYFSNPSGVMRLPVAGGSPALVTSGVLAGAIAVDETDVYVTNSNGVIVAVPKSGGAMRAVLSQADLDEEHAGPHLVALQGGDVYWTNSVPPFVQRAPKSGGAAEDVAISGWPLALATDASNLYASIGSYDGAPADGVDAAPLDGSLTRSLASGPQLSGPIATDAANVYVAVSHSSIYAIAKGGGPARVFAPDRNAFAITTDGECVYWMEAGSSSSPGPFHLVRAPPAGPPGNE